MRPLPALFSLAAFAAVIFGIALVPVSRPAPPQERKVKLAVLVVFDQMRGDFLARWRPLFGQNGFARLQRDGAWFTRCYYPYATTTTGPGHASMLTGACPDTHGIVNNNWMENGTLVYCATEERYQFVPKREPKPETESKPGTKPKPVEAGSPRRLLSETVGDVLKDATGGRAKVFGLSLKDRSAILTTGQRPDGAYWFSNGVFGTSTYYTEKIHDTGDVHPWVEAFNETPARGVPKFANRWFGQNWTRFREDVDYTKWSRKDDEFGEGIGTGQGKTFPHPTTGGKKQPGPAYYEALANSPFGNDLLLEFAKRCITHEGLGTHDVPDLLVVSFSSNDLIGHTWGPDSQEVLDVTLRSDEVMAKLLAFLDAVVGEGQYVLAVTADHGVCPLPEVARSQGIAPDAARVNIKTLQAEIDAYLGEPSSTMKPANGQSTRWVESIQFPWVYLNPRVVKASGQTREAVAAKVAKFLVPETKGRVSEERKHVARAFTRADLSGPIPEYDPIAACVKRSFYPSRSGDVYLLLKPYRIPFGPGEAKNTQPTGTTHGTPYNYDRHVPLLVYGPGIQGGVRDELTTPQAIASIFAKVLNIRRPKDAAFPVPETLD